MDPLADQGDGGGGVSPRFPKRTGSPTAAAPAVALAIAVFLVRTETERACLFREHLRSTVVQVSPLLLDLAAMEQIDVAAAMALMHPPQDWPWRPLHEPTNPAMRHRQARRHMLGQDAERRAGRFRRAFANPGVVIRGVDHPRGRFAIRPVAGVLGFTANIGPCLLTAYGPVAMLRFPEPLPETLVMSMPGRTLGHIVDHPLFRDSNFRIRNVVTDPADDLPVLSFRVPLVPFRMPWTIDTAGTGGDGS